MSDISRVILVGGSTKASAVRETVASEIKEPFTSDRVDEVVSHGAAVVAANFFLPEEDSVPIEISDVTGHSLGIDVMTEGNRVIFHAIIPRQTTYPCRCGFLGFTSRPMQNMVLMASIDRYGLIPGVVKKHYIEAMNDLMGGSMLEANLTLFEEERQRDS